MDVAGVKTAGAGGVLPDGWRGRAGGGRRAVSSTAAAAKEASKDGHKDVAAAASGRDSPGAMLSDDEDPGDRQEATNRSFEQFWQQLDVDADGRKSPMTNATSAKNVLAKLDAWMKYALSEPRIIGFNPWCVIGDSRSLPR